MNISKRAKKKSNYPKLEIGDNVRVPVINKVHKGYKDQFSMEIHKVDNVNRGLGWPGHVDGYCHVERRRSWTGIKLMRQRAGGRALRKPPSGTFDPEESIRAHRNLLRAGNPLAPAVTQPGATGPPGVKSRRRVIPVVTRSSHRRISPRRPLGRCAGVRRLRTQTQPQGARGLSPSG